MIQLPPIPPNIELLPRDARGYPIPWFVATVNGEPEFRLADPRKLMLAIKENRCWVCGKLLDHLKTFVIGPMCLINRISGEPPSHFACAEFSAQACPFLNRPRAVRRTAGLPEETMEPGGKTYKHNPGAMLLWTVDAYKIIRTENGSGILFELPMPILLKGYTEGRKATRAEILEALENSHTTLQAIAKQDGAEAEAELAADYKLALTIIPE